MFREEVSVKQLLGLEEEQKAGGGGREGGCTLKKKKSSGHFYIILKTSCHFYSSNGHLRIPFVFCCYLISTFPRLYHEEKFKS